ncbi:MAG: dihydropteroate synthase [Pseudomonadota bacterium]
MFFHCGKFRLSLARPLVMGIINVTPDSFFDGGKYFSAERAVAHAWQLIEEGADILDIGGESTRPGAPPVGTEEELRRVLPVLEGLRGVTVPMSVDTQKAEVMRAALAAGASMVNDVNALRAPGALEAVATSDCGVCLMHMQGEPRTMQQAPSYDDVVGEVLGFLRERLADVEAAGVVRERIVLDPGFGFGKMLEHNLALLCGLDRIAELGVPVLAGLSRKSMLGKLIGNDSTDRTAASVAAALLAAQKGARILRVHDVRSTVDALAVLQALKN